MFQNIKVVVVMPAMVLLISDAPYHSLRVESVAWVAEHKDVLSLMSKPTLVTLPCVLLLREYWLPAR